MARKPTQHFRDDELIDAFELRSPGKLFNATFIPAGDDNRVDNWDIRVFHAFNKADAVKIAREYGQRIINMDMVYVYLGGKRSWR
jgi:hypothetical protein